MESRYHQYSLASSPWLPLVAAEAEHPLLEDRVLAVPQRQGEAERLPVVADAGHAVLVPPVGPGPGVVVREVVPGRAVLAVVLPDRAPGPLGQVGTPGAPRPAPRRRPGRAGAARRRCCTTASEDDPVGDHVHICRRRRGHLTTAAIARRGVLHLAASWQEDVASTIRFGPQVCGDLAGAADPGVAGHRRSRRLRHGHGQRAADPPLPRPAGGRRGHTGRPPAGPGRLDPVVTLPSGARVRLARTSGPPARSTRAGYELLERFDLVDGLPRWRWRIGDVVLERELAMRTAGPGRGGAPAGRRRPGPAARWRPLCTWRDAHGERHADGPTPAGRAGRRTACVVEGAYRLAGPGLRRRPGSGSWACTTARRPPAGSPRRGPLVAGRFTAELRRPGDTRDGAGLGR